MSATTLEKPSALRPERGASLFQVLVAVSFCHMLNDLVQSLLPSVYPIFQGSFHLSFGQIGLIALVNQVTASLFQPFVGLYTDRTAAPYFLPVGMSVSLAGLLTLAFAPSFGWLLVGGALVGFGSAVFHPESSRVARMASGGQHGFAQSFFQVGGSTGTAFGPLLAALFVLPRGQVGMAWFSIFALVGIVVLIRISRWAKHRRIANPSLSHAGPSPHADLPKRKVMIALAVLMALVFSKFVYLASLSSYYTFYLISRFHLSVQSSQLHLFAFLGAAAAGTFFGGPIGDRVGTQMGHMGVDSGRAALHAGAALRQSLLDRSAERRHRLRNRFGVLGDPGLCAGAGSGPDRADLGIVLRARLWDGWHWRRRSGQAG